MALSARGEYTLNYPNPVGEYWGTFTANMYHEDTNPQGILNLGVAENTLCTDIIMERFRRADMQAFEPWMQQYSEHIGTPRFRAAIAQFLSERFKASTPLDPDNVIVTTGGDCAMDFLIHAITDQDDYMMVPAPYYYSIRQTAGMRNRINCLDMHMLKGENCELTLTDELLESHYQDAVQQGKRVTSIMVLNPNNPTATIHSLDTVRMVLQFADRHDLHVVVDEIYGLTVFGEGVEFESMLQLTELPCPERTHFMWGFSKDLALPGLHVGVIYSCNKSLAPALNHMSCTASVPSIVQDKLTTLIQDKAWMDMYFHNNHSRLRGSVAYASRRLRDIGLDYRPSHATFFLWADLSKFASSREEERALCYKLLEGLVFMTPGTPLASKEPGWFRVTVSHPIPYLKIAMDRLEDCLKRMQ